MDDTDKFSKMTVTTVIPLTAEPRTAGDYVVQELKNKYPDVTISPGTASAISIVAVKGAEEKMRLTEVVFRVGGPNTWPFDLSFKWQRSVEKQS